MSAHQQMGPVDWVWDGCTWVRPGSGPPCSPWPPCPPYPPRPIQGPIAGITNGAAARPGEVGEFLMGQATVNIVVNTGTQTILAQPLVLPPGDWDCEATLSTTNGWDAAFFALSPSPPGLSNTMAGYLGVFTPTPETQAIVVSQRAQALVTVPTLLAFTISIAVTNSTGIGYLNVTARRMR